MNQASRGSRVVFVGNIPFEFTEEQLVDVFKEVGPVASFRLLFDRETGRPKGYGFCEYYDAETAASAVRNLSNYELGGRQLRVDYASADERNNIAPPTHPPAAGAATNQGPQQPAMGGVPPPAPNLGGPSHMGPPPSTEDIAQVLGSMTHQDLLTLLGQMKSLSIDRPEYTRDFLGNNPQLAYALFQSMVMMNLVDPNLISRLIATIPQNAAAAPPGPQPPMQQPLPTIPPQAQPPIQQGMPPSMQPMQPPMPQSMPPPAQMQPPAQLQPPMGAPPMQTGMPPQDTAAEQKALLMQVMQLTDDQINNLPPEHREQVRQLKAQLTMQ